MYACMYAFMYVCVYVRLNVRIYMCVYACTYVCIMRVCISSRSDCLNGFLLTDFNVRGLIQCLILTFFVNPLVPELFAYLHRKFTPVFLCSRNPPDNVHLYFVFGYLS